MPNIPEIKKRYEAARPGPWRASGFDGLKEGANFHDFEIIASQSGDEDIFITNIGPFFTPVQVDKEWAAQEWATAEFIARARSDIPALVTALEEAQKTLGAIREAAALAPSLPASTILDILGESQ